MESKSYEQTLIQQTQQLWLWNVHDPDNILELSGSLKSIGSCTISTLCTTKNYAEGLPHYIYLRWWDESSSDILFCMCFRKIEQEHNETWQNNTCLLRRAQKEQTSQDGGLLRSSTGGEGYTKESSQVAKKPETNVLTFDQMLIVPLKKRE